MLRTLSSEINLRECLSMQFLFRNIYTNATRSEISYHMTKHMTTISQSDQTINFARGEPFFSRFQNLPRSGIRDIMELSSKYEDVIHLEVGQPDLPPPPHVINATIKALADIKNTQYCPNAGVDPLRAAIANYFQTRTGVTTSIDEVMITVGSGNAMSTALGAILNPGDNILIPDPGWPNYLMASTLFGVNPIFYATPPSRKWLPDINEIESLITTAHRPPRALIIVNPSNPTGKCIPAPLLRSLLQLAKRHNMYVISDEIYGDICFGPSAFRSALSFTDLDPRMMIIISGVSKAYSMTGFRVGFMRTNKKLVKIVSTMSEAFVSCGVPFSQMGALAAVQGPQDYVHNATLTYKSRRDAAIAILKKHNMYEYTPEGAFYILIRCRPLDDMREIDSKVFALNLLQKKKVAVAPGDTFGNLAKSYIRVSLASPIESIVEGMERICQFIKENSSQIHNQSSNQEAYA